MTKLWQYGCLVTCLFLASPEVLANWNTNKGKSVVSGYDVVAYFEEGKPVKGKGSLSHQWKGSAWNFSSEKNLNLFKNNPSKYAPQYGGYCAYAMSKGSKAPVDPTVWKIEKGKLYLNYNKQVQFLWQRDIRGHIIKADQHWRKQQ